MRDYFVEDEWESMKQNEYLIPWSKDNMTVNSTEILILGSGIAGLFAALKLSDVYEVTVLTKKNIMASNTEQAQGGIAVALHKEDSPEFHYGDTIKAGADLCNLQAVKILAERGPDCVRELIEMGAEFDKHENSLDFTKEGAHSRSRVLHARGDSTGGEIERALVACVTDAKIAVKENYFVIDLLKNKDNRTCGVIALNHETRKLEAWLAKAIIVATGGLGQIYKYTTNPVVATGDGIAAAYRAGAELMDMEFIQFHPTALLLPGAPSFLISEAARGEGAKLINAKGYRFMEKIPGAELASRDVVARAIWEQMKEGPVYLDFSNMGNHVESRFPRIYQTCLQYGIDISSSPIPVGPAAHYVMGGIRVKEDGRTNLPNLYACGECACNGVHGANRLASNSLLDGLVFGAIIAQKLKQNIDELPKWSDISDCGNTAECTHTSADDIMRIRTQLREIMWDKAGIIRNESGLLEADRQLAVLNSSFIPCLEESELELANMIPLGRIIVKASLARRESRGGHFRGDYPVSSVDWRKHSVIKWGNDHVRYISI